MYCFKVHISINTMPPSPLRPPPCDNHYHYHYMCTSAQSVCIHHSTNSITMPLFYQARLVSRPISPRPQPHHRHVRIASSPDPPPCSRCSRRPRKWNYEPTSSFFRIELIHIPDQSVVHLGPWRPSITHPPPRQGREKDGGRMCIDEKDTYLSFLPTLIRVFYDGKGKRSERGGRQYWIHYDEVTNVIRSE